MKYPRVLICLTLFSATSLLLPSYSNAQPTIGNCGIFPSNNIWNTPIDQLPADSSPEHQSWISNIGATTAFHMDFGSGTWKGNTIGIPFNQAQLFSNPAKCSAFSFQYASQSDTGSTGCFLNGTSGVTGYAIPANALIEQGSDHHLLVVEQTNCKLYEIYNATVNSTKYTGTGGSGAIWDLNSNALRTDTWTSADAAGLPIAAGQVRYSEAITGKIEHAIRFTAPKTNNYYIWPARHKTANTYIYGLPPLGAHFRLKSSYVLPAALQADKVSQTIVYAMKKYGIINADNGSPWYISGEPNAGWNNTTLNTLANSITGVNFEPVDTSCMMVNANSGQADSTRCNIIQPACTYSISPSSSSFKRVGGTGSVSVVASASSCSWTIGSHDTSIAFSGSTFTGSQTLNYTVSANTSGLNRVISVPIASQTFLISQSLQ